MWNECGMIHGMSQILNMRTRARMWPTLRQVKPRCADEEGLLARGHVRAAGVGEGHDLVQELAAEQAPRPLRELVALQAALLLLGPVRLARPGFRLNGIRYHVVMIFR